MCVAAGRLRPVRLQGLPDRLCHVADACQCLNTSQRELATAACVPVGLFVAYWPWFSPTEQVDLAVLADETGLDSVWVSEAWGQDAVSVLGLLLLGMAWGPGSAREGWFYVNKHKDLVLVATLAVCVTLRIPS